MKGRIASFIGFVPADRPRLVILVVVDEPEIAASGGKIAAPIFQVIARQGLEQLGIKQTDDGRRRSAADGRLAEEVAHRQFISSNHAGYPTPTPSAHGPNFLGMSLREAMVSAAHWGCRVKIQGSGYVVGQEPLPDAKGSTETKRSVRQGVRQGFRLTLQARAAL